MSLRPNDILNQIGQEYNLYWTRRIEPVYSNNNFYNKDIYGVYGEYLPDGKDGPKNDKSSFDLKTLLDKVSKINSGPCTLTQFNVESTNGIGYVPFNFECECIAFASDVNMTPKPKDGIVDVKNEISIQENINDGTISINKNVQVKAISVNNSDPIDAAKAFAMQLSGATSNWKLPNLANKNLKAGNFSTPVLISDNHTADVYNGIYSIQQSYITNLNTQYLQRRCLVRNEVQIQSGIDGIATLNIKTTLVGNKESTFEDLKKDATTNTYSDGQINVELSSNVSYDEQSNTLEINKIMTNDKSIDTNYKIYNTISYNYDFIGENYSATTNSEARPINKITQENNGETFVKKENHKTAVKDFDICQLKNWGLLNKIDGKADIGGRTANHSENFGSSPSIIFESDKVKYRDLTIEIQYQPGIKKISATPILSGEGKYYLEDLDYNSNSQVAVTVAGKYLEDNPPAPGDITKFVDSGFDLVQLSKKVMTDEKFYIDNLSRSFTYTAAKVGNDTKFAQG